MSEPRRIVALTRSDPHVAAVLQRLREDAWHVVEAARPYEAALQLTEQVGATFIVRTDSLGVDGVAFLERVRALSPCPQVILWHDGAGVLGDLTRLCDLALTEPFTYSELLDSLEAVERGAADRGAEMIGAAPEEPAPALPSRDAPALHRVVDAARRLTELERDRGLLLSYTLDAVMDVTDAERGSLLLATGDGRDLELAEHRGAPGLAGEAVRVRLGEDLVGTVADRAEPLIGNVDGRRPDRANRGYRGTSFLLVPLRGRKSTVGVLCLTDRRDDRPFGQDDLLHAMMLADHAAASLSNSDSFSDLHALTVVDPLTGLYNRRHFEREVKKEIERARRHTRTLTLALVDVDNFKSFNDTRGYTTGDAILKKVGGIIQKNFREVDVITRWGGDEFAVLLPDTGPPLSLEPEANSNYLERVRRAVERADLGTALADGSRSVTLSVGVATYPVDGHTEAELFRAANRALKRAKSGGRNRTCYATDNPPEPEGGDPEPPRARE